MTLPPQVVFRAMDYDNVPRLYVAYLVRDPSGNYLAALSRDEMDFGLRFWPKLDPLRLVRQHDDVSEEPFYLYLGVVDIRQIEFEKLTQPPASPQESA